jgi:PIN domain nuclease of toxin-antitoxin system
MTLLIDSHTLIWALDNPAKLTSVATTALQDPTNDLRISAASVWEIAIKVGKGNLPLSLSFRTWMDKAIADLGLSIIPITLDHADRQSSLPFHHRDPFDRMLASQALIEGIPLVSSDSIFDTYGVNRIWK